MGPDEGGSASGVTLAVTSDQISPEEITSLLDIQPTRSGQRSDLTAAGKPSQRHSWRLDVPDQGSLTKDLEWLAGFLSDHAEGLDQLTGSGAEMATLVYVGISQDDRAVGLELAPRVLARFGAAGVRLEMVVLPD